jgi:threonine synthase
VPLSHLECAQCGRAHNPDRLHTVCPDCGGTLLARYDLAGITRDHLAPERTLWRYRALLPVRRPESEISLGEGATPLLPLHGVPGLPDLWLKDEGTNPTGSFKARGAAVGLSRARELGATHIALPTAGNAGGAWSAYAARARIPITVVMPADATDAAKTECLAYRAHAYAVEGLIGDAGTIVGEAARARGWFDASTLREPYRVEGKKTIGFELAEAFGWRLPDAVLCPVGGGVGVIALGKAFAELRALGWVAARPVRLVAVQSAGCAPVVRAFWAGAERTETWTDVRTEIGGLRVPSPFGGPLVLRALRESGGNAVAVPEADIHAAVRELAAEHGILACPEGAATLAAARILRTSGWLRESDRVVLLNTGSGLKCPAPVAPRLPLLRRGQPLP